MRFPTRYSPAAIACISASVATNYLSSPPARPWIFWKRLDKVLHSDLPTKGCNTGLVHGSKVVHIILLLGYKSDIFDQNHSKHLPPFLEWQQCSCWQCLTMPRHPLQECLQPKSPITLVMCLNSKAARYFDVHFCKLVVPWPVHSPATTLLCPACLAYEVVE